MQTSATYSLHAEPHAQNTTMPLLLHIPRRRRLKSLHVKNLCPGFPKGAMYDNACCSFYIIRSYQFFAISLLGSSLLCTAVAPPANTRGLRFHMVLALSKSLGDQNHACLDFVKNRNACLQDYVTKTMKYQLGGMVFGCTAH